MEAPRRTSSTSPASARTCARATCACTTLTAEPALPVELQPRQLYTLGRQGEVADIDGSSVELGRYARLTLTFSGGDEVEIEAPIVARTSTYSDVAEKPVSPESSATPTPSASPSPTAGS
ncbi:hypothetical protein [Aeromicrobium sp. REDSEA-S32_B7]|uniref:hypothetical protein n=1 Tax=Aeromicrobium sp. REDSEA-S32_B7 TaxID=1811526 RepID=UPI000AA0A287|nr:hypothetical protein [Aeromicrobium sp. REDSEA-S32_B7]